MFELGEEFARREREWLVLKPSRGYGGEGVLLGQTVIAGETVLAELGRQQLIEGVNQ